jgi:hypothetical protein
MQPDINPGNVALDDGQIHRVGMTASGDTFSLESRNNPTSGVTYCGYPFAYKGHVSAIPSELVGERSDDPITCKACQRTVS